MHKRKYKGELHYKNSTERVEVSAFIVREHDIGFEIVSRTGKDISWEAESGKSAQRQEDGSYVARGLKIKQLGAAGGVTWNVSFNVIDEVEGESITVTGKLFESKVAYEFDGTLDAY